MSTGIIYCAHCLVTGKKYIGQTRQEFKTRIKNHKNHSKHLDLLFYRAINKHGWDNFVWGIVEECDLEILNEREIYWIQYYNTYKFGYNTTLGGSSNINPNLWKSFKLKSPDGKIVEDKNAAQFCRDNNLLPSSICLVLSGKQKSHKGWTLPETEIFGEEYRMQKMIKTFKLKSSTGEIIEGTNIKKFCKENNLRYTSIIDVLNGKFKSHKGWSLVKPKKYNPKQTAEKLAKEYRIMSPDGKIFTGKNINEFCRKNNLCPVKIGLVLMGKRKSHKKWKLPETKLIGIESLSNANAKEFALKSPSGEIIRGKNVSKFCKEQNLSHSVISTVLSGKRKSHKGWTKP